MGSCSSAFLIRRLLVRPFIFVLFSARKVDRVESLLFAHHTRYRLCRSLLSSSLFQLGFFRYPLIARVVNPVSFDLLLHASTEKEKPKNWQGSQTMFFPLSFIQYESFAECLARNYCRSPGRSYGLLVSRLLIPPISIGRTESNRNKAIVWSFCRGLTCVRYRIVRGSS